MAFYAQTSGNHSTNSGSFTPIPGLAVTIPEGVGTIAIVILNVPNPFAQGDDFPGGNFGVTINGTLSPVQAVFTYNEKLPQSTGRIPTTLVVGVPLGDRPQAIVGVWAGIRGSNVVIDSPATLTAIL